MKNSVDIKLLPANTPILIDANIFIYHFAKVSDECKTLLHRIEKREVLGFVTTSILAEVLHRRMLAEAVDKGLVTASKVLQKLKTKPDIISQLTDYIVDIRAILQLPLNLISATSEDIEQSHGLRQTYGLFVNDSINLACALRVGVSQIATHDTDFDRVDRIKVWKPTDI